MNEPEINEALRAHVTRVGFDLSLGKTHITPAGRLVINLLKEAGIYQEYAALIPIITVAKEAS